MNFRGCCAIAAAVLIVCVCGCDSMPSIPVPWAEWFKSNPRKPGPLPEYEAKMSAQVNWRLAVGGKSNQGFVPAIQGDTIFAAGPDGSVVRADLRTGAQRWRVSAAKSLSAGTGADTVLLVVGTDKGDVFAFDPDGRLLWQTKVSSEVAGPPKIAEGIVVIWSLDGRIFGLSAADGSRKWVYQRTSPPLELRRFPGGSITRGGLFSGTAGGKLLAIDLTTGTLGWEGNVATPKGATELERIADVTSLPVLEPRQVCAVAYQGRVACFDLARGSLIWSRDFSSLYGLAVDNRYLYLTDDKGSILALDKTTGASIWKQDKLAQRYPAGPVVVGDYLAVIDVEGYVHFLDRDNGNLIGRVATDGSAPLAHAVVVENAILWQSSGGNLLSVSPK